MGTGAISHDVYFGTDKTAVAAGDPSVETAAQAVRLGAFDYLPKPVKERDLLRVTRLAL